jgi:TonB family protein
VCGEPLKTVEVGQNQAFAAPAPIPAEEVAAAATVTAAPMIESNAQFVHQGAVESSNGASSKFQDYQQNLPEAENIKEENHVEQPVIREASYLKGLKEVNSVKQPAVEETFQLKENNFKQPVIKQVSRLSNNVSADDGMYHLTMLQTPPTYRRYLSYGATFGLFALMTASIIFMIVGIYSYNLDIESPEIAQELYGISVDEPTPVEVEKVVPQKNKDDGGGGGGGGRKDPKPASEGAPAPQRPDPPMITPSVNIPRLDNPSLRIQATTQGPVVTKRVEDQPYGIKGGGIDPSDGPGRGLGQGNGTGTGQGNGIGTGIGNGNGSGIGNGNGNGYGNGRGDGTGAGDAPPAKVAAVTEKLNIISKPRANYTEEARKNQVSGTVRVRVTFSASGQVTGIAAVNSLPYGLTDQAIAAARQIKFTPQKQNGQPVSVNRVVEYNFNLY